MNKIGNHAHDTSCLSKTMEELFLEQKKLAGEEFKFVSKPFGVDTIPFMFFCRDRCGPFEATGFTEENNRFSTSFFKLENIVVDSRCAELKLLKPVDIDGCPIYYFDELYSLLITDQCITVDLKCFRAISPFPPKLVNRPVVTVDPKC